VVRVLAPSQAEETTELLVPHRLGQGRRASPLECDSRPEEKRRHRREHRARGNAFAQTSPREGKEPERNRQEEQESRPDQSLGEHRAGRGESEAEVPPREVRSHGGREKCEQAQADESRQGHVHDDVVAVGGEEVSRREDRRGEETRPSREGDRRRDGGRKKRQRREEHRWQPRRGSGRAVPQPDRGGDRRVVEGGFLDDREPRQTRLQEIAAVGHLLGDGRFARLVSHPERAAADSEGRRQRDESAYAQGIAVAREETSQPISHRLSCPKPFETPSRIRYRFEKNTAAAVGPIN